MAKLELEKVQSGYQSTVVQNSNWTKIEDIINDRVFFRNNPAGEPNQQITTKDMNGQRIINLPDGLSPSEPLTVSQASAITGNPGFVSTVSEVQIATDSQTLFTLLVITYTPGVDNISVYINGVFQNTGQYSQPNTNQILFTLGLETGDNVDFVVNQRNVTPGTTPSSSVTFNPPTTRFIAGNTNLKTYLDSTDTFLNTVLSGTNTPESAVTANVGSLFLRTDGGANTTLYVKEVGTGNTGWVAK